VHLRIAQLAPPYESIPPSGYGGTERVVGTLAEELVRRGHSVTLFAPGDSRTPAELVPIVPRALWHVDPPCNDFAAHRSDIYRVILDRSHDFDVLHSHMDHHGFALAERVTAPLVTTIHSRLDVPSLLPTYRAFAELPLVSVSNSQRRPLPLARWVSTVYNGINVSAFEFASRPGDYLAFLGRISPEKGLDTAIRVARRTGLRLVIAARPPLPFAREPEVQRDRQYFEQVIQPMLSEPGVELVGQVAGAAKNALLARAAALLFPIRWPEPFGLVMAEALACGTPVVALRDGSVPEVLRHGVTGFIGVTEDDLVRGVERVGDLDREACRREAEQRFSPAAMAEAYESVYTSVIQSVRATKQDGALLHR
jgi:glycosyltransferase involved in cell wall biosynthesis